MGDDRHVADGRAELERISVVARGRVGSRAVVARRSKGHRSSRRSVCGSDGKSQRGAQETGSLHFACREDSERSDVTRLVALATMGCGSRADMTLEVRTRLVAMAPTEVTSRAGCTWRSPGGVVAPCRVRMSHGIGCASLDRTCRHRHARVGKSPRVEARGPTTHVLTSRKGRSVKRSRCGSRQQQGCTGSRGQGTRTPGKNCRPAIGWTRRGGSASDHSACRRDPIGQR